jgi:sortase (surface protein transpeptidase)
VPLAIASHDARLERVAGPRPIPVAVRIASLGVDAPVVPSTVEAGALLIPDDATTAAWYQGGPIPGEPGSAVVAAHVDFGGRPGAFYHLEEAKPADAVDVVFDDGSTRSFRVVALGRIPRDALPSDELFAPLGDPTLTLITCGGDFDSSSGHYSDNVVLRAVPVS